MPKKQTHADALGNPINEGDYIAYAVTSGRSAVVKFGRVVELRHGEPGFYNEVCEARVDAVTVENAWGDGWKMQRITKASPLGGMQALGVRCIVVIPCGSMPNEAIALLDAAYHAKRSS